ncbi:MAG: cobalt-precorrin-5B (C(1))-methyltransferase [Bacillus subtilis]|nr:cobalt-precorrin-5B (C(1))-methyltransferase [Bacillus subtilis]
MYCAIQIFVCDGERCKQTREENLADKVRDLVKELGLDRGERRVKVTRTLCNGACRYKNFVCVYKNAKSDNFSPDNCIEHWRKTHEWTEDQWKELILSIVNGSIPEKLLNYKVEEKFITLMNDKLTKLKSGFSTGSHAASALKAAFISLLEKRSDVKTVDISMPDDIIAKFCIESVTLTDNFAKIDDVIKSDNDDIDVTKGCRILCYLGYDINLIEYNKHKLEHNPHIIECKSSKLNVYAGKGLGVATKSGLKVNVGYPAINPTPLNMMRNVFIECVNLYSLENTEFTTVFEVVDGRRNREKYR